MKARGKKRDAREQMAGPLFRSRDLCTDWAFLGFVQERRNMISPHNKRSGRNEYSTHRAPDFLKINICPIWKSCGCTGHAAATRTLYTFKRSCSRQRAFAVSARAATEISPIKLALLYPDEEPIRGRWSTKHRGSGFQKLVSVERWCAPTLESARSNGNRSSHRASLNWFPGAKQQDAVGNGLELVFHKRADMVGGGRIRSTLHHRCFRHRLDAGKIEEGLCGYSDDRPRKGAGGPLLRVLHGPGAARSERGLGTGACRNAPVWSPSRCRLTDCSHGVRGRRS